MRKRKMIRQAMAEMDRRSDEDWERQIKAIEVEAQRLVESGTAESADRDLAFINLARHEITKTLEPDETVRQEGVAFYEIMNSVATALLALTDRRLVWSVSPKFETVLSMRYEEVVQAGGQPLESDDPANPVAARSVRITYRPANFPEALRRINRTGELDATFDFINRAEDDKLRMAVLARIGFPGPHDEDDNDWAVKRLRDLSFDVTSWEACPLCCHDLEQKAPSTVRCLSKRGHIFSAPDVEPIIDETDEHFGEIVDEQPWMPVLEGELEFVGKPLIWVVWKERPYGPPKVLDYEMIRAAWVEGASGRT
jgi:hypothetical protein